MIVNRVYKNQFKQFKKKPQTQKKKKKKKKKKTKFSAATAESGKHSNMLSRAKNAARGQLLRHYSSATAGSTATTTKHRLQRSNIFVPIHLEAPKDAVVASHKLLIQAGFVKKVRWGNLLLTLQLCWYLHSVTGVSR
jgi:hypothetical protein